MLHGSQHIETNNSFSFVVVEQWPCVHESCATLLSVIRHYLDRGEQKVWMMRISLIQALIHDHAVCQRGCVCSICCEWRNGGCKYYLGIEAVSQTALDVGLSRGTIDNVQPRSSSGVCHNAFHCGVYLLFTRV